MAASVPPCSSDLRMVLIRPDRYGSDSVANIIFGRDVFEHGRKITSKRETYVGEVNGRKVCLVRAPVWLRGYSLCDTPNLVKDELVLSVAECPPGPHAFIIQIEANLPFTNLCRRSVEQHMELLGENVWNHTLVLFTLLDWQNDGTVEQHIESEGEALQWLLKKCANRYHAFNSFQNEDIVVEQLLRKVEEMVAGNSSCHFEIDSALLNRTEQRKSEREEKAKERRLRLQEEREKSRILEGDSSTLTELRLVMVGWVIAGKRATGHMILNMDEVGKEGHTTKSVKYCGQVEERQITIVETPGWWKYLGAEFTSHSVKAEILEGVSMCTPYPHAFLLMIPADTSFTEEQKKIVQDNMKLLGEQVWSHTIVVFPDGKWLGDFTIEDHIESEGEALQWLIETCGNRYHVFDKEVKDIKNVPELLRTIEEMVSRNSPYEVNKEMLSHMEDKVFTVQKEDALLLKMVEVLYGEWDWRASEWNEVEKRQPLASGLGERQSMVEPVNFCGDIPAKVSGKRKRKLHRRVKQEEKIETLLGSSFWEGKETLSELMEKTLKNFDKDKDKSLGDESLQSDETVLRPQWKELIEKEWCRRENMLIHAVVQKVKFQLTNYDDTSRLDPHEKARVQQKVRSWLKSYGYQSGTSVGTPGSSYTE